ncbi:SDR family oxidoreductase [Marinicella sp. W31]|uniref:SDR family oxidoreductase n=1 Tax=Marinicella sp. W31 TaxID=3023713 RepID=UPI003758383C
MKKLVYVLFLTITFIGADAHDHDASEYASSLKNQKAVLVTGASSGLGLAMAEKLAAEGFFVYAGARKKKDIEALSQKKNMQGIRLDVTIQADIDAAVATVKNAGRGLYGLINNAGVAVMEPLIEVSEESMQFQMDVNVFGPYRVTKAFAPLIIENQGRISTTSSILGVTAGGFTGPYSMSKHATEAFTDTLAAEMKKFNVHVSVIEPGNYNSNVIKAMRSRMQKNIDAGKSSRYQDEMNSLEKYFPADRSEFKAPDEVAAAAWHAMSSEQPKRRYLVAPVQKEADWAIRGTLERLVQLNQDHQFSHSQEALIKLLKGIMAVDGNGNP